MNEVEEYVIRATIGLPEMEVFIDQTDINYIWFQKK